MFLFFFAERGSKSSKWIDCRDRFSFVFVFLSSRNAPHTCRKRPLVNLHSQLYQHSQPVASITTPQPPHCLRVLRRFEGRCPARETGKGCFDSSAKTPALAQGEVRPGWREWKVKPEAAVVQATLTATLTASTSGSENGSAVKESVSNSM